MGRKKGCITWNKGLTKEIDERVRKTSKTMTGRKYSEERKRNISKSHIGLNIGDKHPNWQGGKSFEKYTINWTKTLKRAIKERDKFRCQTCGIHQEEYSRMLDIHHIDENKQNCNVNNLITLCRNCHMKLHRRKK